MLYTIEFLSIRVLLFLFSADSLDSLKRRLPGVERELTDQSKFRDLYQFTFNFAKNPEQKGLGIKNCF